MKLKSHQNIALFGTSADPPTNGHKKILEELSKIYPLTITYASNNPKKIHRENFSLRSLLLKTLIEEINNPKIIFNQNISSQWAIETIKKSRDLYDSKNIDFVIGSDLISEIFQWRKFEKMIKEVNFFIIKRKGYPLKSNALLMLNNYNVKFKISSLSIPNISSSMIRSNTNFSNIPESLIQIINKNNLYRS